MILLTDFGDLAVLLPLATVMLLWLLAQRQRRGLLGWAGAVAFCCGVTAVLKIYFSVCAVDPALQSPSGHTSFSMLVYGGIALVVAAESTGWQRLMALAGGIGLVAGIAVSRIVLGAHTPLEVILGMVIGAIAVAVFAWGYLSHRPAGLALRPLLVTLVVLAVLLHGQELHAEEMLHAIGRYLHLGGMVCP
jgi:membrane-associated phospholipid phosphatase